MINPEEIKCPVTIPLCIKLLKKVPKEEIDKYREIILTGKFYEFFLERINHERGKQNLVQI